MNALKIVLAIAETLVELVLIVAFSILISIGVFTLSLYIVKIFLDFMLL